MKKAEQGKRLSVEQREKLVETLRRRFEKHRGRHEGVEWAKVLEKLDQRPEKLWSLNEMEESLCCSSSCCD